MKAWFRQHLLALSDSLQQVARTKGSFALNVLVIAVALALPFAGLTLTDNLDSVTRRIAVEPSISVFLANATSRPAGIALETDIRRVLDGHGSRGRVKFIPREDALKTLQEKTRVADAVAALGDNPLPDAYLVTLEAFDTPAAAAGVDALAEKLVALPGVEQVQVDSAWVKQLAAMLHVLRVVVMLLASTLALVVVAVAFNTIRLQVMTQHAEIDVARLVGATDRFIYRPFYYTGALLGTAAGMLGLAVVALSLQPLNQAIGEFTKLYATQFQLASLDWPKALLLVLFSALLGVTGSALSIRRHLSQTR